MKHKEHYDFAIARLVKNAQSNNLNDILQAVNRLEGIADTIFCYEGLDSKRHNRIEEVIKKALKHMNNVTENPLKEYHEKQNNKGVSHGSLRIKNG